jgi:hypothetical protein
VTQLGRRFTKQRKHPSRSRSRGLRRLRRENGQSFVEFVVIAPVLFVLIFAIFEFGIALKNYITLTRAVSVGGRAGAVCRFGGDAASAAQSAAGGLSISPSVSYSGGCVSGGQVTVSGSVPFQIDIPFLTPRPFKVGSLTASTTERIE